MGFDVEPDGLDALHRQLDRGSQDAAAIRGYWEQHAGVDFTGEGLLNIFQSTDDRAESNIGAFLNTLAGTTMPQVSDAVTQAAAYYRSTDQTAAARLDSTMPGTTEHLTVGLDPIPPGNSTVGTFADEFEPQQALKAQIDYNVEMPYQPSWTDLASPTSLLRDAIWVVTDLGKMLGICDRQYDIFEVVLKPVCGDWAGIKATGVTMSNIADALSDLYDNLGRAMIDLGGCWHGNAADAAFDTLRGICQSLNDASAALWKLGSEYVNTADACYSMSSAIGNLLSDITDAAVIAAATATAGGALAATGVGVPISLVLGAITLTRVWKVVTAIYTIVHIIADMTSRVNAFASTVQATGGNFGILDGSFTTAAARRSDAAALRGTLRWGRSTSTRRRSAPSWRKWRTPVTARP